MLTQTALEREREAAQVWQSAAYPRGLTQVCGVERCQARSAHAQRNHIGWAIRAVLRLEHHRIMTGTSWFEPKLGMMRAVIQPYLGQPSPILKGLAQSPATA